MSKVSTAVATVAASLMIGLTADAGAAGFELVGVNMSDHYMVTLRVSSLADLQSFMEGVGFAPDNPDTSFADHQLSEAGLTFTYSGSWTESPLITPNHTQAPGGLDSLTETSTSGQRFSLGFSYKAPAMLADGSELVSFAIKPPPGVWGKVELTRANLNPFTLDTGTLSTEPTALASFSVTNVPEPSTYLTMALGLAALGLVRRARGRALPQPNLAPSPAA